MALAESTYLKPKGVGGSDLGTRKKANGMFQNVSSYPQLGGFSDAASAPGPDRPLALEKGDLTRKGRPI
jgi:hypothetical protein